MQYCQIIDNVPQPPQYLPATWANVSNFYALDAEELPNYGFYPCHMSDKPEFDPSTQKLVEALTLGDAEVFQTWHIVALTPEEQVAFVTDRLTEIGNRIDPYLDQQVQAKQYNSIVSATSWALSNITVYKGEAEQAAAYRDSVWQEFGNLVAGVQAGTTALPTADAWFASLAPLWPQPVPPTPNGTSNGTL